MLTHAPHRTFSLFHLPLQVIQGSLNEIRQEEKTSTGACYTRIIVTPTFI